MMAYNLVRLFLITEEKQFEKIAEEQVNFMRRNACHDPMGYAMYLMALSDDVLCPASLVIVDGRAEAFRGIILQNTAWYCNSYPGTSHKGVSSEK